MTTPVLSGSLIDDQIKLETEAVREGVARYRQIQRQVEERGDAAMLKPCERLMAHWFGVCVDMLELERAKMLERLPHKRPSWWPFFDALDSERMAVAAMHEAISQCVMNPGVRKVHLAMRIGSALAAEFHADVLKTDKEHAKILRSVKRLRKPTDLNDLARRLAGDTGFGIRNRCGIGVAALEVLIHICSTKPYGGSHGIVRAFQASRVRVGKQTHTVISLSDAAHAIIDEGHDARKGMRPRYLPMLVEPLPWKPDAEGGYLRTRTPLVIGLATGQRKAIGDADMAATYEGLNVLSGVPWRINRRVLGVVRDLWERGGSAIDVPPASNVPLPPMPEGCDRDTRRRWRGERAEIHALNIQHRAARRTFLTTLQVAERMEHRDRVWFPHQLDFRGRAYPIPQALNHQQGDLSRGLLEFADERPLGDVGLYWLKVHTANCFGVDKVSYDDRVAWVDENIDTNVLDRIGTDHLDEPLWQSAEKPWEALAACLALIDPDAASRLPIQIDGTCNGIQHLAAIGRDAHAGAMVNLVPADKPADFYTRVAEQARLRVEQDIADGSEVAPYAIQWLKRKIIKRVPMTKAYGVTAIGARNQIREEIEAAGLDRNQARMIAEYLGPVVLEAVDEVCPGPAEIMAWLRACAKVVAKAGHRLAWTAPGGFPVIQPYMNFGKTQIVTLGGRRMYIVNPSVELSISVGKQINGSSPNVVHSIDARHMLATAVACHRSGITFAGVHDSYWTHAQDVPTLAAVAREEFATLHRPRLLEGLRAQWEALCGKELPAPPKVGSLDIEGVTHSPYFFS